MSSLSRPDALGLASSLGKLLARLPYSSRVAVAWRMHTAMDALESYASGRALERQQVVTALVFLELELRQLGRTTEASAADSAERERLWGEIEAVAASL